MKITKIITILSICISVFTYTTTFAAGTDDFVTVWATTVANETITIPTRHRTIGFTYNYTIDCGANADAATRIQTGVRGAAICTYPTPGTNHEIRISGNFPGIYLDGISEGLKIKDIKQWGTVPWTSFEFAFRGALNMTVTATDAPDLSRVSDMGSMFAGAIVANPDVSGWNVSTVTKANSMFSSAFSTVNYDKLLASWSVQKLRSGVVLGLTTTTFYCNAAARAAMSAKGWTFIGDSIADSCPTNHAPTATALPAIVSVDLGQSSDFDLSDTVFADTEDDILTLSLSAAAGTLTATGTDDVTVIGSGTAALELSGAITNLHTYLDTASVIQYNSSEESVVTVRLRDARTNVALDNITINNASSATVTAVGLPTTSIIVGQSALDLSTTTLYGPRPDTITLTLSADTGTWNATSTGGVVATASGSTLVLAGTLSAINTYLDDSTRIQYSPTASSVVTVTANDGVSDTTLGSITVDFFAESDAFITTWTTTAADTITIPVYPTAGITGVAPYTASDFRYHIDCGNNQPILLHQTGNTDCVYPSADTYTVKIYDNFPGIHLDGAGDSSKLTTIEQWGTIAWRSMYNAFIRATNVTISPDAGAPDLSATTTLRGMFAYNTALTNQDLSGWDTSTITNMNFTFANSTADLDLSGWDVSAVTTADGMFREAGLSTANYDKLLAGWSAQTLQTGVVFTATGVQYCNAAARSKLTSAPNNWNITDGGAISKANCGPTATGLPTLLLQPTTTLNNFDLSDAVFASEAAGDITVTLTATAGTFTATSTGDVTISGSNTDTLMLTGTPEEINTYLDTASAIQYSGDTRSTITVTASDTRVPVSLGDISMIFESDLFVTTWQTTTNDETITIPINTSYTYNYNVDCDGDGTFDIIGETAAAVCTYPTAGTHEIHIGGTFPAIYINRGPQKGKIKTVEQWGTGVWKSFASAFLEATTMTIASDAGTPDTSAVTSMRAMFGDAPLVNPDFSGWDTGNVTNMELTFLNAIAADPDLSGWDVSSVTNARGMFQNSGLSTANYDKLLAAWSRQTLQPLTGGDSKLGAIGVTYCDTAARTALITAGWTPAGDTQVPLAECGPTVSNLAEEFVIDTENPIDFDLSGAVFASEVAGDITVTLTATAGTLTATGTSNVTISGSGTGAIALSGTPEEINTYLDTASAIQYSGDTQSTIAITASDTRAPVSLGDISMILESDLFITTWQTTTANETITIPINTNYTYNYNVDCGGEGAVNLFNQTSSASCTYDTAGTYTVKISGTFPAIRFANTGDKDKIADVTQWGTGQWRSFDRAFYGASNMTVTATDTPDLSATGISMTFMFDGASAANPDTSGWNTSNVIYMSNMFRGATVAVPDTSAWDTGKVVNMSFMFEGASAANPDTSGWNTSNVVTMRRLFFGASAANPDVSSWDVRKVTDVFQMFSGASVATPDVSGWQTDSLAGSIDGLFYQAAAANPDVSGWDVSRVTRGGSAFRFSALSTANYDKLLESWSTQDLQSGVTLGVQERTYCNTAARAAMSAKGWTFDSDSLSATCPTNTAPTATGLPENIRFVADTDIDFDLSGAVFTDAEDDILTLNLAVAAGTLTATGTEDVTVIGSGTAALELSGTITNLHTYLDTASAIQYNSSIPSAATVQIRDARTAVALDNIEIFDNTTIIATGLPTTRVSIGQSEAFDLSTTTLYTPNPDTVTLTLSADTGTWNATSTGGVVATASESTLSLAGSLSAINTYLDDSTRIQYSPTASSSVVTVTAADGTYDVMLGTVTVDVFAESDAFITTWTTTAADTITIPVYPAAGLKLGTPDAVASYTSSDFQYHVDCDNNQPILLNQTGNTDCVYASADTYTIKIYGNFPGIYLNNEGDKDKLTTIEQWGTIAWRSMYHAFYGASKVTINPSAGTPDISGVTNLRGMFADAIVANPNTVGWDTSSVTNMRYVFPGAAAADPDLSGWDVSAVTSAEGMLNGSGLSTVNYDKLLAGWSTQTLQTNVLFGATGVQYCDVDAHTALANKGWTITGDSATTDCGPTATGLPAVLIQSTPTTNFDLSDAVFASQEAGDITVTLTATAGTLTATGTSNVTVSGSNTGTLVLTGTPANINTYLDTASAIQYSTDTLSTINITAARNTNSTNLGDIQVVSESDLFVTIWQTTTNNETITIPVNAAFTYNYNVDCGGGGAVDLINQTSSASCTYDAPGMYTVKIAGTFPAIYFNNTGDKLKIRDVSQWGTGQWQSFSRAFYDASNMAVTASDVPNLSAANISMNRMFYNASVADPDVSRWDVRNVTDMYSLFRQNRSRSSVTIANPDVSRWQTDSLAGSIYGIFFGASVANPDVSGWDVSRVTDARDAFNDSAISIANYDKLLAGWSTQTLQPNVILAVETKYCNAAARSKLTSAPNNWQIVDRGRETNTALCQSPPTVTGLPTTATIPTGTDTAIDLSGATFADADDDTLTVTLSASAGTWTAATDNNLSVTVSTTTLTLSGSAANINTYLDSSDAIQYRSDASSSITITLADEDNTLTVGTIVVTTFVVANLDIDGNGFVRASTDGILIARYIASVRGESLIAGAVAGNASRTTSDDIEAYLGMLIPAGPSDKPLDIDGNGTVQASTDGILIARYIASVRGASLIAGAVSGGASADRNEASEIEAYLSTLDL